MPDPASRKKKYNIEFLCEGDIEAFPYKDKFEKMARKLLAEEGKEKDVNIVLCTDEFVRTMNRDYRGLDKVTDVLSFEWKNELGVEIHTSPLTQYNGALGAALFAAQIAKKRAAKAAK